jgi:serine protease AprX
MASQVDEFMAANPDMLVMFAAGNSGVDADKDGRVDQNSIGTPGTAKNVMTVGASKNLILKGGYQMKLSETRLKDSWPTEPLASSKLSENAMGMAAFSSRGPTADGRMKPDVVAPGTNILSVHSSVKGAEALWGLYNNDYAWSGGTSMATPVAAGGAALIRQYLVEGRGIASPSAALLKAVMMHTATDLFPGEFGEVGATHGQEFLTPRPNVDEGYGRVDVDKATNLGAAILVDERAGLATGETHTYPVTVTSAAKLTATLVYTDAAGSASAAKALVNDLDLVLVDPSGHETSLNDHVNNSEMIQANVSSGNYTVKVKGTSVPTGPANGKQPYALVLSLN